MLRAQLPGQFAKPGEGPADGERTGGVLVVPAEVTEEMWEKRSGALNAKRKAG